MSLLSPARHVRPRYRPLTVTAVEPVAAEAVAVTFAVPDEFVDEFLRFSAGQHVTLSAELDGETVRQSYSITWSPQRARSEQAVRIGVAQVPGGRMSTWLTTQVRPGDVVDVLAPIGDFTFVPATAAAEEEAQRANASRLHVAVAGGSGITPVLSILQTALTEEPGARFVLLYGTRSAETAMFRGELEALGERFGPRLRVIHVHSREAGEDALLGRIEPELLDHLMAGIAPVDQVADWWLCGPEGLVDDTSAWLRGHGVPDVRVHHEVFHTVHHRA